MSEKKAIQILKERKGPMSEELKARIQEQNKIQKGIKDALKNGPKTVPEIARASGIESHKVLWNLMAMKKYGIVVEGEMKGDYHVYGLSAEGKS